MRNPLLEVTPVIPAALSRLPELAGNLFFGWHRPDAGAVRGPGSRAVETDRRQSPPHVAVSSASPHWTVPRPIRPTWRVTVSPLRPSTPTCRRSAGRPPTSPDRLLLRRVRLSRKLSRSIPAASACWRATTARRRATSARISSRSACYTGRDTSPRQSTTTAIQHAEISRARSSRPAGGARPRSPTANGSRS